MALQGQAIAVGTSDTTLYTCPATIESSVHGLVFSNPTAGAITISLKLYKQSLATTVTVGPAKSIAANDTFTWPKPINLNAGDYIVAIASGAGVVALYSAYENTASPVASGFKGRGAWSAAITYAVNDIVTYSGGNYLALQVGVNQQPDTATSYWMELASGAITSITAGFGLSGGTLDSGTPTGTFSIDTSSSIEYTGKHTYSGTSSALAIKFANALEKCTVSATAATGTINYDVTTQTVLYYTTAASGNFTMNLRASSSTTLNAVMAVGESLTAVFLNTNSGTARYNTSVQIDGTTTGVTTEWQGGSAPTSGNANSIDVYSYTIIKTANATFTVLASQVQFA